MTTACYDKKHGVTERQPNAYACGPPNATTRFVNCCWHDDFCLWDNICHYTHPQSNGSGYYISGCTDPDYQDPSCPKPCADAWWPDIVHLEGTSLWACCTTYENNTKICQDPTDETWQASSPTNLATIGSIPAKGQSFSTPISSATSSTSSVSTSTLISITSSTATSTSAAASRNPSGLSTGAQAGIGVGVAIGALLVIALGFLWYRRAARKRHQKAVTYLGNQEGITDYDHSGIHQAYPEMQRQPEPETLKDNTQFGQRGSHELRSDQHHELSADRQRYELSGD